MPPFKHSKKLTVQDLYPMLFDALMVHIEPDLMVENRAFALSYLRNLSEEEYRWQMQIYEEAYQIFLENWPGFVERAVKELGEVMKELRRKGDVIDVDNLKSMEHMFEKFPDASDAA